MKRTNVVPRSYAFALLATLLAILMPGTLYAEDQRHTLGFPLDMGATLRHIISDLEKLLSGSSGISTDTVRRVQDAVQNLAGLGAVDAKLGEAVQGYATRSVDLQAEAGAIGDEGLRHLMNELLERHARGTLTMEDVDNALKSVNLMYERGSISHEDYIRALKILRELASQLKLGELYSMAEGLEDPVLREYLKTLLNRYKQGLIDERALVEELGKLFLYSSYGGVGIGGKDIETLKNMLTTAYRFRQAIQDIDSRWLESVRKSLENLFKASKDGQDRKALEELAQIGRREGEGSVGVPMPSPGLPSISLPQLGFALEPRISTQSLALVAMAIGVPIAVLVAVKLLSRHGLQRLALRRGFSKGVPGVAEVYDVGKPLPKAVRLYWESLEIIRRRLGLAKGDSETHREFLSRARPSLKGFEKAFEGITYSYELCRFGGVDSADVERMAEEGFKVLVSTS